jgi:hypothetical protein
MQVKSKKEKNAGLQKLNQPPASEKPSIKYVVCKRKNKKKSKFKYTK